MTETIVKYRFLFLWRTEHLPIDDCKWFPMTLWCEQTRRQEDGEKLRIHEEKERDGLQKGDSMTRRCITNKLRELRGQRSDDSVPYFGVNMSPHLVDDTRLKTRGAF